MALRLSRFVDMGCIGSSQRDVVRILAHELIVMMVFEMMCGVMVRLLPADLRVTCDRCPTGVDKHRII